MGTALSRLHTQPSPSTGARLVCVRLLGTNPVFPAPKGLLAPTGHVCPDRMQLPLHACLPGNPTQALYEPLPMPSPLSMLSAK